MDRWRWVTSLVLGLALVGSAVPVVAQESDVPSLPDDLPLRDTPDVPLFVGPARLKLSGKTGAYTWGQALFGAQIVEARVAVVPEGESCATHLRLKEDGEAVVDAWFASESGQKETHEASLDVDYLAGKLKVDSDCKSWSVRLAPIADPELPISIKESYYPVKGDTIDELVAQTEHIKDKWAAYTEWYTSWAYWTEEAESGQSCGVMSGETEVEVTMRLPNWRKPKDVDPAVEAEWQRFMQSLRLHEQGHVTIAAQGGDAIDDRLDEGFDAPTCEEAGQTADATASVIFERYAKSSKRYDKETEHGLTQGTSLS